MRRTVGGILGALAVSLAGPAGAETRSATVGVIEVTVAEGRTVSVSAPFEQAADPLAPGGLAEQLAGDGADGDWLHVWMDSHFGMYTLSGGIWRIAGTNTTIPSTRLRIEAGTGWLISRRAAGTTTLTLIGAVRAAATVLLPVAAGRTALLAYPFPVAVGLNDLPWDGAATGDELRLWDRAAGAWIVYTRQADAWSGPEAQTAVIAAAGAFLYSNRSGANTTLTFVRPY